LQQWSGKAAEDKERFDKEMSNYDAPEMSEEDVKPKKGAGKKAKPKKDANAPKKPKSAFIFYGAQVRPQILKDHPELKQTEIMKKVGEMWKAATEEDKAVSPHCRPSVSSLVLCVALKRLLIIVQPGMHRSRQEGQRAVRGGDEDLHSP
jgi:hypothetical protein